jgi:hypothetical protein
MLGVLMDYERSIVLSARQNLVTLMPVISPGLDKDWEVFERKRTTPPLERLSIARYLISKGVPCGVNGEPFIPGVHTVKDFEQALKLLKEYGIDRYNTYNFHFNAFVARRIHENCPSVDIEKIWYYNKDKQWKPILQQLIDLAKKHNVKLGCPDFVNSGWGYKEPANTCCGVDVPNPCTFNTHYFKSLAQDGLDADTILESTWDGIGNFEAGRSIVEGKKSDFYTLKDAGLC